MIMAFVAFFYVLGAIAQSVLGKEIVIEKEIVIVEKVTERREVREDAAAASSDVAGPAVRRSARIRKRR